MLPVSPNTVVTPNSWSVRATNSAPVICFVSSIVTESDHRLVPTFVESILNAVQLSLIETTEGYHTSVQATNIPGGDWR